MFNISAYLEKFKKLGDKKDTIKREICDSLKKETGIMIDFTSVRISHGEISISAPPNTHALIFMKRERIIADIKKRLPDIFIDRIRCR